MLNPMRSHSDFGSFDQNFKKAKRRIGFAVAIQFLFSIAIIIAVIVGIVFFINNPEVIGEFFGKIVNGFNSTK